MAALVKICGLRTADAVAAALAGGTDFVGFVFYPPSPRNVTTDEARVLAEIARGRAGIVALLVDPSDALIEDVVAAIAPDLLQLHGSETVERVREVKRLFGVPVMKAIKVETAGDAEAALDYIGVADRILFDAKVPKGLAGALPGGMGSASTGRPWSRCRAGSSSCCQAA